MLQLRNIVTTDISPSLLLSFSPISSFPPFHTIQIYLLSPSLLPPLRSTFRIANIGKHKGFTLYNINVNITNYNIKCYIPNPYINTGLLKRYKNFICCCIRLSQLGICHTGDLSDRSCLGSSYLCQTPRNHRIILLLDRDFPLTSLKRSQGTPVKAGSKLSVSSPMSWSKLKPSSDSAHSLTLSAEVVVMSNISRQTSEASGGKSEVMIQLIRGTYSPGSVTCNWLVLQCDVNMFPYLVKYAGLHQVPVTFLRSVLAHERPTSFSLRELKYQTFKLFILGDK